MASRKDNIKSLFSNTRTRVIVIFTLVLLGLTIFIGYMKLRHITAGPVGESEVVQGPAGIESIPGVMDQTAEYASLQEQQNVSQAKQAEVSGGSAIPTIIRTQAIGEGVGVIGAKPGESGVGFVALTREEQAGNQNSLWVQALKNEQCSKTVVDKVISQGAQLTDLKTVCSCIQLKNNGYSLEDLDHVCQCKELKAAGYNARQLKDIGYSAERLRMCGFVACELRNAGFGTQEMKDGGFSDGELKGAGYTDDEILKASGLPDGIPADEVRKAGCSKQALIKLKAKGVSVAAIRRISGCSIEALKAAGFLAKELKDAGFSAAELKSAGFLPEDLKASGYDAQDLLKAGFSPDDLTKAGFTPQQIQSAQNAIASETGFQEQIAALKAADCTVESLKKARAAGVSVATIKQTLGCSAQALMNAGYGSKELKAAGFTAAELKAAGFSPKELKDAGFSPKELKDAGFSASDLKKAGVSAKDLKNAGYSAQEMQSAGLSAKDLKDAGFSAQELKDAGFSANDLKNAGFSAKDLKDAGVSGKDLKDAGFSTKDLKDAGLSPQDLKNAGFSAADLKKAGFSAQDLKNAGYQASELSAAGYSVQEIQKAGFSLQDSSITGLANPNIQSPGISSLAGMPSPMQIGGAGAGNGLAGNNQLQAILNRQNEQMAEQKYQQQIQQRTSDMQSAASQSIQGWKQVNSQVYNASSEPAETPSGAANTAANASLSPQNPSSGPNASSEGGAAAIIKTGDILFAVMDTSVNSDEPGPILATIVSGRLKGAKLIGSFNRPANANKMVITFNSMSVPGAPKTIPISAYAIDPNTARTALSSKTNHHYLMRYGSLFASSFLQGFGNAFQSANTTVTIGGTGGGNNITVSNGIGRSALENAVIGLAQVGQNWSQQAQILFNTPTTVEVYSGTGIGILFIQDISIT